MSVNTERLLEIAVGIGERDWRKLTIRIPPDESRDADLVVHAAAKEIESLRADLARVSAEREALRADKERLDWLDAHPREGTIRIGGDMKAVTFWGISAAHGQTMRAAIDAARGKEQK